MQKYHPLTNSMKQTIADELLQEILDYNKVVVARIKLKDVLYEYIEDEKLQYKD